MIPYLIHHNFLRSVLTNNQNKYQQSVIQPNAEIRCKNLHHLPWRDQSERIKLSRMEPPIQSKLVQANLLSVPDFHLRSVRLVGKTAEISCPRISLNKIKHILRKHHMEYKESHPCLRVEVPSRILRTESNTYVTKNFSETSVLYINKVTGVFICPLKLLSGSWNQLEKLIETWEFNKKCKPKEPVKQYPVFKKVDTNLSESIQIWWDNCLELKSLESYQFNQLLQCFKLSEKDYSIDHFKEFDVRVNNELNEMYFPIRYISGELVGFKKLYIDDDCLVEELAHAEDTTLSMIPLTHNLDVAWATKATSCVLVGSMIDSISLSARTDQPILCLADWTNLPLNLLPFLEQFTLITIWLGTGTQGVEAAKSFSRKIGESRCRIVSNEWPCAFEVVRRGINVNRIILSAIKPFHEYVTNFDTLRHDVLNEFVQHEQMEGTKWTRFEYLNETLRGFRRGEMTVFTGRTGSGKTTFMSEYSLDLCMQGVSTLWGSFEVKNVRLIRMMMKQFGLINLETNVSEFDRIAEQFSKLPLFFTTFHGTEDVEKVLEAMAHAVYVHDIAHVVIDNIQFMVGAGGGGNLDRFSKQDHCVERFRKFATLQNVHVTLIIHPRKELEEKLSVYSIFGGGKATQEADNVLLLQEESVEESMLKRKSLEIAKNRYAGDLGEMPLQFTKPILSFSKTAGERYRNTIKLTELGSSTKVDEDFDNDENY